MDGNLKSEGLKAKPSLVAPDFEGLWSVAWIGCSNALHHKVWGFFCQLLFVGSWFFGATCVFWMPALLLLRCYTTLSVIVAVMAYPYVFEVKGWPWAVRNLILAGANWYEGGCSLCYELPPDGFEKECTDHTSKQTPVLFGYHPHGLFAQGYTFNAGLRINAGLSATDEERRQYYLGHRARDKVGVFGPLDVHISVIAAVMMKLPFWNQICPQWSACCRSAAKKSFIGLMQDGQCFSLLPGGFYEATLSHYGKEQVYIKNVKGFIKYALQFGYRVCPLCTFGEVHTYRNLMNLGGFEAVKKWLNAKKIPTVIPFGKWFCPIVPLNTGVGIHSIASYGKRLPTIAEPTQADIDEWHTWYMQEIKALFDRNKHRFGMDTEELHIC